MTRRTKIAALAVGAALVAPLAPAPATAQSAPTDLVRVLEEVVWLSPDGDGRQDRAVEVSHQQLRPEVTTVTMAAPDATTWKPASTGGPTDPASASVGKLDDTQVGPGDGTAWTPFVEVDLGATPYLPNQQSLAGWRFHTNGGSSYDVASFTVEYRYYLPTAG